MVPQPSNLWNLKKRNDCCSQPCQELVAGWEKDWPETRRGTLEMVNGAMTFDPWSMHLRLVTLWSVRRQTSRRSDRGCPLRNVCHRTIKSLTLTRRFLWGVLPMPAVESFAEAKPEPRFSDFEMPAVWVGEVFHAFEPTGQNRFQPVGILSATLSAVR